MQLATLVIHPLTDCCLVKLINVTLACEDANSKIVEVFTVVDVDDEKFVLLKLRRDFEAGDWSMFCC